MLSHALDTLFSTGSSDIEATGSSDIVHPSVPKDDPVFCRQGYSGAYISILQEIYRYHFKEMCSLDQEAGKSVQKKNPERYKTDASKKTKGPDFFCPRQI